MPQTPLCIKVPGKLMIAGEFAVLKPYQRLVVMAVDRFVYATISESPDNLLTLEDFGLEDLHWSHQYQQIKVDTTHQHIHFVKQAMLIACDYLHEQSITLDPFALHIKSELDDESGKKYGLGSSAAVVTAVITAILTKHFKEKPSPDLIYKLASISHVKTQGNGSGADIAASTYGGILQYTSFQAEWLLEKMQEMNRVSDLVEEEWVYLSVKRMQLPEQMNICIGWTGTPASTANLVDIILRLEIDKPKQFEQFLINSREAVDTFLRGVEKKDIPSILEGVEKNRHCLEELGKHANVEIETPLLHELAHIARQFAGAGKLSGAGGGDCGIAFIPAKEKVDPLQQAWKEAGIKPLSMNIFPLGAEVVIDE